MTMNDQEERYSRQTLFDSVGKEGQERLQSSKAVIIGIGALGTNIANMMARAGFGHLVLVDRDVVELNNLQRQVIFDGGDIGKSKAEAAALKLEKVNPTIRIEALPLNIDHTNILTALRGADIVLDGTDNLETRFLINDACVKLGMPWVYGGAVKAEGMSMTIVPGITPCLRCLLPKMPGPGSTQNCNTVGIINTIPTMVASYQATEAIKFMISRDYSEGLALFNIWDRTFEIAEIERNTECQCCSKKEFEFLELKELGDGKMDFMMVKTCEADAYDAIPKKLARVNVDTAVRELETAGYNIIADAGVMCVVEKDGLELQLFSSGRVLIKTPELEIAEKGASALFGVLDEGLKA